MDTVPTLEDVARLREAATVADARFSAALKAAYGARAGDARYRRAHPDHPDVEAARIVFDRATEAFITAFSALNRGK